MARNRFSITSTSGSPALLAAIGTTIVLWGSAFVAIRAALPSLGFESVVSGRLLLAAGIFAILARPLGVRRPARAELPLLAAIGATGLFGYQTLLSAGEEHVPAGISALIFAAAPVLVLLLARPLLGERLNRRRCAGVALAVSGVATVASTQGLAQGGDLGGSLLVFAAICCYAPWVILTKLATRRIPAPTVVAWSTWFAALLSLPFSAGLPHDLLRAQPSAIGAVVFLGVVVTTVPFALWTWALARVPAAAASSSLLLIAPAALIIAWLVLGERPPEIALIGGAVTLAGVTISQLPRLPGLRRARRRVPALASTA
jgi:drug/metabolite transporter (DMT)-like permease